MKVNIHFGDHTEAIDLRDSDLFRDVSHLALEVELNAEVYFTPEAWAYCEPEARSQVASEQEPAIRDEHARNILRGLRAELPYQRGRERFRFRSYGGRRQAPIIAVVSESPGEQPSILVGMAARSRR